MNMLKQLEKRLAGEPNSPDNATFKGLIKALCLQEAFDIAVLYELTYQDFELAMSVMKNWRLDRYTKTKNRLTELAGMPST